MTDTPVGTPELLDALPLPYLAVGAVSGSSLIADLEVRWANRAARVRFGDDLVGRRLRQHEPLGAVGDLVDAMTTSAPPRSMDCTVVRGGRVVHERFRIEPVGSGWGVLVEDIADEVRTRGELDASTDALARVQRWGNVGVWDVDLITSRLYWSTQVFEMLGVDHAALSEFRAVVHPDDIPLIDHLQARLLAQPGPYQATHRIIRDGEIRTLDQHVQSVADAGGRPVRLIGTVVDVTDVHQLRDRLLDSERMRTIGVVAAGVAHDFNNLLTVVDGHAGLLLSRTDDATTRASLEAIKRAASQASTTTRKLMGLGRREEVEREPVELTGLFADVAAWTRPAAPEITLVETVRDPELVAEADASMLRQVLLDLVLNARDAQATTVRLVAAEGAPGARLAAPPGTPPSGRYVQIDVVDDGTGMDEATRARAIEPFFSTKERARGSGLGLANASVNVTRMGGFLEIASEPGRGTTVTIELPGLGDAPDVHGSPARDRATRVVVGCSDPALADELGRLVAAEGHQVVVATDVQALAFCLASEPIDGAVVDIRLARRGEWPADLRSCPTLWVDERSGDDALRWVRNRVGDLVDRPGRHA